MSTITTLSNDDIVSMANAKVPDSAIISAIKSVPSQTFDLSVSGLIALGTANISGDVINAMQYKVASTPK